MKTPDVQAAGNGSNKQKTQLMLLSGLALVLVLVLVKQFGGDGDVAQAATASTTPTPSVTAAASSGGDDATPAPKREVLQGNLALAERPTDESVSNDAFHEFWQPLGNDVETPIEELPPPKIKLNATLVPDDPNELAVAVIDGRLKYVGDNIQGWWLHSIDRRAIALRSPGDRIETIAMPLLQNAAANAPRPAPVAESTVSQAEEPGQDA